MPDARERAIAHVASLAAGGPADPSWRVTLHFHPDRLTGRMPILERMAADGVYQSQFETGTSNGGLTAHPGGDRWRWENRIFAGAYDGEPAAARPNVLLSGQRVRASVFRRGLENVGAGRVEALVLDPCYRGTPTEAAARTGRYGEQALKRVWHYVARFGHPGMRAA